MKGKMNLWLIVWIGLCTDADNIFLIFFWCVAPPTSFFSGVYRIAWKDKMDCPMFEERLFWMPAVNQDHALHKLHTQIRRPKLSKKKKKKMRSNPCSSLASKKIRLGFLHTECCFLFHALDKILLSSFISWPWPFNQRFFCYISVVHHPFYWPSLCLQGFCRY